MKKLANFPIQRLLILFVVVLFSCADKQKNDTSYTSINKTENTTTSLEPILPIRPIKTLNKDIINLGKDLFHDVRLSENNTISCASCHNINTNGTVEGQFATGINGNLSTTNTPTVFNAFYNFRQFWDGRADNLSEQITSPLENPLEMGTNWPTVIAKLNADDDVVARFNSIYNTLPSKENITDAIVTFEKSLITPSRFDDFLLGNNSSISDDEKKGYEIFKRYGCIACHQGKNVGGNMFQKFGIFENYYKKDTLNNINLGRFNITGNENDKFYFKVPSLRNVAITAPYFHDGSVKSLDKAIEIMAYYQLGRNIPKEDIKYIKLFLNSLTGKSLENQIKN